MLDSLLPRKKRKAIYCNSYIQSRIPVRRKFVTDLMKRSTKKTF